MSDIKCALMLVQTIFNFTFNELQDIVNNIEVNDKITSVCTFSTT